jgi:hypothetical protein
MSATGIGLTIWFAATAASVAYIAYDLLTRTPEMKVMKWGWVLVALYTGPFAFAVYWFSCREPALGTHETFVAPLWKQSVGSTIHCLAGDATGIILAASVTVMLGLPMGLDLVVEYAAGFSFGLLIFQSLFMKDMLGGSYIHAVRKTWLAEWLSMNAVMSGMIPVMVILMSRHMSAMEPTSGMFWAVMSLATLVGAVLAFPINWWLVKHGLKHGMGTDRALGRGGSNPKPLVAPMPAAHPTGGAHSSGKPEKQRPNGGMEHVRPQEVSNLRLAMMALLTLNMLGAGIALAAKWGNLSMHRSSKSSLLMNPSIKNVQFGSYDPLEIRVISRKRQRLLGIHANQRPHETGISM